MRVPQTWRTIVAIALLSAGAGCSGDAPAASPDDTESPPDVPETDPPAPALDPDLAVLSPTERLVRISMSLRGQRPAIADLERVAADPSALGELVDDYMRSPEFGVTMRDLHNETLLMRAEILRFPARDGLAGFGVNEINESMTEAPLRLIEDIIASDRPYTEIVTADYAMANDVVTRLWAGISGFSPTGPAWQRVSWDDSRPKAGILSSSAVFLRHRSAGFNYNRGRANAISKALLCYDFLSRDVIVDGSIDLSDPDAVANAVVENADCASCHQSLDPLASFFWGWRPAINGGQAEYPVEMYFSDREGLWQRATGREPAFFGLGGSTLDDLGTLIAEDPRFSLCAAERFYTYFAQIDAVDMPFGLRAWLQEVFVDSGFDAKALTRAIMLSPQFAVAYGETDAAAEQAVGLKKARPAQLARMMEELTGFQWKTNVRGFGDVELLQNDTFGFRVLGGGIDSFFVIQPSHTMNATASLMLRSLATQAAGFAVDSDFSQPADQRRLLTAVEATTRDESAIRTQLVSVHARLHGLLLQTDSADVDDSYALFRGALERTDNVARAWKTTLAAMLQDPRVTYY